MTNQSTGIEALGVNLAGGGLLWRDGDRRRELAVVHRTRYDDWTLPKGKLRPERDGSWSAGAVREVEEETSCDVELGELAGCISYPVDDTPKVVLLWHMALAMSFVAGFSERLLERAVQTVSGE